MATLSACTIVSKNYLPYARVLARSFAHQVPGGRFFVLLVDRNDGHVDPATEPFELLEAEDIDRLPDIPSFLFKYTLLEANTAIKPYFLEHLFDHHPTIEGLVYFDPDILITGSLDELAGLLDRHQVVLTPHLTAPIEDQAHPDELAILQAGSYNLGFVALRRGEVSAGLLRWWQERLWDQCVVRIDRGLFVDQKWMDLVPGLFGAGGAVHIQTHPGWNVAYWNLHGRMLTHDGATVDTVVDAATDAATDTAADDETAGYRSNGQPLTFFHFSGIQPESLEQVSKHQDRFRLADLGVGADLYRLYARRVIEAGYFECRPWPYAFACFDNGVPIPDAARALYLASSPARRRRFGDPFHADPPDSFYRWLGQPAPGAPRKPPHLTRLLAQVHRGRPDLVRLFPDPAGRDFPAFSSWLADHGRHELRLDPALLDTLFRESRATLLTVDGLKRRVKNRLQRLSQSAVGKQAKTLLKGALGHDRTRALKRRLRGEEGTAPPPPPIVSRRLALPERIERPGINLVGYLSAETGMGEAARSLARALESTGIPVSLHNLELNVLARRGESRFAGATSDFPYDINLLVVNADQVDPVYEHLGAEVFAGRVNIGYWLWELEVFPQRWYRAFDVLHEIWTPSSFCLDTFSSVAPIPVRRLPLPVEVPENPVDPRAIRERFALGDETFVVLYLFNFLSHMERKHPRAAIRAFRHAFAPGDDALLLLKSSHAEFAPEARRALEAEIGDANVRLVDDYLDRDTIDALMTRCNTYLSLHRSEGYGLTVAEAMARGKPVVATAYSGVMDFFDARVGLPIDYELVEITDDEGPYPKGAHWAEPDIDQAAQYLRRLHDDPHFAQNLGQRARRHIARTLAPTTVGQRLRHLFDTLLRRVARENVGAPTLT